MTVIVYNSNFAKKKVKKKMIQSKKKADEPHTYLLHLILASLIIPSTTDNAAEQRLYCIPDIC